MSRHYIRKRNGKRGVTWEATVELSRDPATGKRRQKYVSGPTRKATEAKIAAILARDVEGKPASDSNQLLSAFLAEWLDIVRPSVKGGSMRAWRSRIKVWIAPHIGNRRLRDLTPQDVNRLMATMLAAGKSQSYANAVYSTLRTALNHAVRWELITSNPCSAVKPPKMDTEEMQTWSPEEVAIAIEHLADDPRFGALWRLALTTGMRVGELVGLRWADIDLDRGLLSVRQAVARGEYGEYQIDTPKTARGRRSISISPADVQALKRHRAAQNEERLRAAEWEDNDLVFCNGRGRILRSTPIDRAFRRLTKETGLQKIRFHDMRHTSATLMMFNQTNPKVAAERMGHSSTRILLDRYSHVIPTMQEDAAAKIEDLIENARKSGDVRKM